MSPYKSWFRLIIFSATALVGTVIFIKEYRNFRKKQSEQTELVISKRLRRISYLNAIIITIYLYLSIWVALPKICQYGSIKITILFHWYYNICISWFQLERLKVCFGNNNFDRRHIPYSYPLCLFYIFRLWILFTSIYAIYISFFLVKQTTVSPFGCSLDASIHSLQDLQQKIVIFIIIATDWMVLFLYIFKIVQLSCNVSNRNDAENSVVIKRRLRLILSKIFIMSIVMEATFIMTSIGFAINDQIIAMITFNRISICLDAIISMKGLFLMLEENGDELESYAKWCHCTCLIDTNQSTISNTKQDINSDIIQLDGIGSPRTDNISINIEHLRYDNPSEITRKSMTPP